ncbi:hypothetical protein [Streptomyces sp. NBC_00878]|uniref:hypothetical protein n=1 Tax=Streptomyces sp. NBC_00878 TaxID=2975854 RepID=UPI0022519933|nr:hypothetical protein [Streptomyces sp. NBC_00878]MCX4910143.1 hypothetical protein [Streptomyces sp. NBC_00878]
MTNNGEGRSAPPRPATEPRTGGKGTSQERPGPGLPLRPFAPPRPTTPAPRPDTPERRVAPPSGPGAAERPARPPVPPRPTTFHPSAPRTGAPWETPSETTTRLRPLQADPPAAPGTGTPRNDIHLSSSAESFTDPLPHATRPPDPAHRPFVSLAAPDTYDSDTAHQRTAGARPRPRLATVAACVVLGLGLIGGAVTGSWLSGDSGDGAATPSAFTTAGELWHSIPVDQLFPPTVDGEGAGPGGADRVWTRIAVAPDSGCEDAFDTLLRKALAPAGCLRLLRATYTDATRSHLTTVGLLFTKADAAVMGTLRTRFKTQGLDRRSDLVPRPYAARGTLAAGFGDAQRASWTVSVVADAPVVVYAVSGFADGRTVPEPQPAEDAMKADATTPPAQAGLGHDARGLADRVERSLRKTVNSATEKPS